jgi:putative transposase
MYEREYKAWDNDPDLFKLKARMRGIFDQSDSSYGSRRMTKQLRAEGFEIGRYRVRGLMKQLGLKVKQTKRYKVTTNSRHNYPVAPNILNREFDVKEPDWVWGVDITYIWTLEGWLYLAIVMDLFSRQIVGWAMDKRLKTQLAKDALAMAFFHRKPAPGLLHHSDQGSQYASNDYQKQLSNYKMIPSMSRKGNCWDNAPVERFFRSLKSEKLAFCWLPTRGIARNTVVDYITYYNAIRLHSSLGYLSPMDFESDRLLKVA